MSELNGSGIVAASAADPYQADDAKRGTWFAKTFDREMEEGRGFLWLPVCFGIGMLVYFALPVEPSTVAVSGIAFGAAVLAWTIRRQTDLFRLTIALTFVA
jgi:competence protein ComEC